MSENDGCGVVAACFVVTIFALFAGHNFTNKAWERACVKRGVAEYNTQTSQWQWKEPHEANKPAGSQVTRQAK
jgi:hypothetical protein